MAVKALSCKECGTEYGLEARYVCERCFGPLEVRYDLGELDAEAVKRRIQAGPQNLTRFRRCGHHRRAGHEGDLRRRRARRGRGAVAGRGRRPALHRQPRLPRGLRRRRAARPVVVDAIVAAVRAGSARHRAARGGGGPRRRPADWLAREAARRATADAERVAARAVTRPATSASDRPRVLDLGGAGQHRCGDRDRHLREALEAHAGTAASSCWLGTRASSPRRGPRRPAPRRGRRVVRHRRRGARRPRRAHPRRRPGRRRGAAAPSWGRPDDTPGWSRASTSARPRAACARCASTVVGPTTSAPPRSPALGGWRTRRCRCGPGRDRWPGWPPYVARPGSRPTPCSTSSPSAPPDGGRRRARRVTGHRAAGPRAGAHL